jgi:hypothetical protein
MSATVKRLTVNFGFSEAPGLMSGGDVVGAYANRIVRNAARLLAEANALGYRKTDLCICLAGEPEGPNMGYLVRLDVSPSMADSADPIGDHLRNHAAWIRSVVDASEGEPLAAYKRWIKHADATEAEAYAAGWAAQL